MPYIPQEHRKKIKPEGSQSGVYLLDEIETAGGLNWLMSHVILKDKWKNEEELTKFLYEVGRDFFLLTEGKYQNANDVMGAYIGCRLEFKRRFYREHIRGDLVLKCIDSALDIFYDIYLADYEDMKKEENGDVLEIR